jgi:hypothetical protein
MNITAASIMSSTAVLQYEMIAADDMISSFEGNHIGVDGYGRIDKVQYADGSQLRRHESYVLVKSVNAGLWFGDNQGHWFAID